MRQLYTALLYLATPLILARLAWSGLRNRGYWRRWPERFGWAPGTPADDGIWVHAVSVGEVIAALPLIDRLRGAYPGVQVTVTTMTPTGSERVRAALGDDVHHVYLPYDLPGAVRRFLDAVRPRLGLLMETELWPNLVAGCASRGIPLVLANARLSAASAAGYRRVGGLVRALLGDLAAVAAQADADARRFVELGAAPERVVVTGSIKFDLQVDGGVVAAGRMLREELGAARPCWIAASTHDGEDEQVLDAHARIVARCPRALLQLVPRHPERFARVAALCASRGFSVARRSRDEPGREAGVYLGDTMGELLTLYAAADVAFVGGSLVPTGGHNPLEPAALGVPVIAGPHMHNFARIGELLERDGALRTVADVDGLTDEVLAWLEDPGRAAEAGAAGRRVVERNRGALERLLAIVGAVLDGRVPAGAGD
ncbi:MAG: lipid IV(A) 3-deoxy-D-manno-octulosonic acid transferase [Gammaproteobacteria bacterium]|nr:lipid IV(A) 3-deoxy-D-manno-octulosonic acid transferase [Gammaproteobacteria bacterium]